MAFGEAAVAATASTRRTGCGASASTSSVAAIRVRPSTIPYADWTGYTALALDVWVDGDQALPLVLKVTDEAHDDTYGDRFHAALDLAPARTRCASISTTCAGARATGTMDLSKIRSVQLFVDGLDAPRTVWIDGVRLAR